MMVFRGWTMGSALFLVAALGVGSGCSGEEGATQAPETAEGAQALSPQDQAEDGDEADGPAGSRARRPHGGPDLLLVAALRELELTPAQKTTIEEALAKAGAGPRERGPKDRPGLAALAAGVRAGKIDTTTVLASTARADQGAEGHGAAAATALQTLHATLTPEQRRALVDSVTKRMEERGPANEGRGKKGNRGAGGPPPGGKGPAGRAAAGPLAHLLHGIEVTDAQRESIGRALEAQRGTPADHEGMKERSEGKRAAMRARLEGFAAATFDAKAFVAPPEGGPAGGPKQHFERMVKDLAVVVPMLEPAQREALAARLEKGPPMGPPGGPREHGPRGGSRR